MHKYTSLMNLLADLQVPDLGELDGLNTTYRRAKKLAMKYWSV